MSIEIQANHAYNDYYSTLVNEAIDEPAPGLIANDNVTGDLSGNQVHLGTVHPQHGTVDFDNRGGGFLYTPNLDFEGTDTFGYFILTTTGDLSNEGIVTIVMKPPAAAVPVPTFSLMGLFIFILLIIYLVARQPAFIKPGG